MDKKFCKCHHRFDNCLRWLRIPFKFKSVFIIVHPLQTLDHAGMRADPSSLLALTCIYAEEVKVMRLRAARQQPNHSALHPQFARAIGRIILLRSPSCRLVCMRMNAPRIRGVALLSKHMQAPSEHKSGAGKQVPLQRAHARACDVHVLMQKCAMHVRMHAWARLSGASSRVASLALAGDPPGGRGPRGHNPPSPLESLVRKV
eukprot:6172268-Pleurochrysis_carterae.AAC.1